MQDLEDSSIHRGVERKVGGLVTLRRKTTEAAPIHVFRTTKNPTDKGGLLFNGVFSGNLAANPFRLLLVSTTGRHKTFGKLGEFVQYS